MWCTQLAGNEGPKKSSKTPSAHHCTTLSGYIFATKAHIDNWKKKLLKQQYLPHMSSKYGELWPTSGWDLLASLGHPCNFQRVSIFAALLHGIVVVGVSQILRHWTYIECIFGRAAITLGIGPHF